MHRDALVRRLRSEIALHPSLSAEYCREYEFLPLRACGDELEVASLGDMDPHVRAHLERVYGARVTAVRVERAVLSDAILRVASGRDAPGEAPSALQTRPEEVAGDHAAVARALASFLSDAVHLGASDIHFEAVEEGMSVRMRVDGRLIDRPSPAAELIAPLMSRIKLLARLNIAERRRPQDGHFGTMVGAMDCDVRVSTVPSIHGEAMVLRVLDRRAAPGTLEELGFRPASLGVLTRWAGLANGLVVVTGPTGSGKTTTLHRLLALRSHRGERLVSVEDPVEYVVDGVTQVPVVEGAGVTFGAVLRSVLRQDPDVLMVGEIRDAETAAVAVRAALTGHLVLSTLHTNDAPSAIARLRDMGVPPYLLSTALRGVSAQRLVRRTCKRCEGKPGSGCDACGDTGRRGRVPVSETLTVTASVGRAIARGADVQELLEHARAEGFTPMDVDAEAWIAAGAIERAEWLVARGDLT